MQGHDEYAKSITTRGTPESVAEAEDRVPALFFASFSKRVLDASQTAIDIPSPHNIRRLSVAAGQLILSMAQIVAVRLDTSYVDVLDQNIAKIHKRTRDGTIFDKTGGDMR